MASVPIQKIRKAEAAPAALTESIDGLFEDIRRRAYELFVGRGGLEGWEMDDWLRAERELLWWPAAEMIETDQEFQVRIAAPGLEAKDLQVSATPDWIVVQGETGSRREKQAGTLRFSEFSGRRLYRRVEFSAPVAVDKITAALDKGILQVRAAKVVEKEKKQLKVKRVSAA